MKCRFCNTVCYPENASPVYPQNPNFGGIGGLPPLPSTGFVPSYNFKSFDPLTPSSGWLCLTCPSPVKIDKINDNYSILCLHNEAWYEIAYFKLSKQYVVYRIKNTVETNAHAGTEFYSPQKEMVLQVDSEENINPSNAKQKLITLLTFS